MRFAASTRKRLRLCHEHLRRSWLWSQCQCDICWQLVQSINPMEWCLCSSVLRRSGDRRFLLKVLFGKIFESSNSRPWPTNLQPGIRSIFIYSGLRIQLYCKYYARVTMTSKTTLQFLRRVLYLRNSSLIITKLICHHSHPSGSLF